MGEVFDLDRIETEAFQRGLVESDRSHIGEMDPLIDRLVCRGVIDIRGLHWIGEDEISAGLEYAREFFQHACAVAGMQEGFLAPDRVKTVIRERDLLEYPVDDLDFVFKALFRG